MNYAVLMGYSVVIIIKCYGIQASTIRHYHANVLSRSSSGVTYLEVLRIGNSTYMPL
jgi:hypothetical protein